jgi:hypothetical protein
MGCFGIGSAIVLLRAVATAEDTEVCLSAYLSDGLDQCLVGGM